MGNMKTEDYIVLGVGAFIAYKLLEKKTDEVVSGLGNSFDFSNLFGDFQFPNFNVTMPNITLPNIVNLTYDMGAGIIETGGEEFKQGKDLIPDYREFGYSPFGGEVLKGFLPITQAQAAWDAWASPPNALKKNSMLNPGKPDPYTGAKPELLTGMPQGAQWANSIGEGYAYDWATVPDPANTKGLRVISKSDLTYTPSPSPFPIPTLKHQIYTSGGNGYYSPATPQFSTAPKGSVADIKAKTLYVNANTLSGEQRAIQAGLVHLGTPLGTPSRSYNFQEPNSIITIPGGLQVTDANGVVVTDTSMIINQSARAQREYQILHGII